MGVARSRPRIALFDYPDVFEDFYPRYGVSQREFATTWSATGNHAFARLLQREVGDVDWYELSLAPELRDAVHAGTGCRVRVRRSSSPHRALWKAFYATRWSWRWNPRGYAPYAVAASYLAPLSRDLLGALYRARPDAIFSQDYASGRFDVLLAIARSLGVPLFAYHSGSLPDRYVGRAAKRLTIRRANRLLVSSAAERDLLVSRFGAAADRVAVVLTPIDLERFRPARSAGAGEERRRALFVGRLDDRVKRVSALIRAFAEVEQPDAELVIAGSGPDEDELRRLAEAEGRGRVSFLGWVGPDDLPALLASADVLALPSVSEGFPTVVGEALACGTPVIGTRVGGIPELVEPGRTGWLLEPGDDAALARALGEALAGAARGMRAAARAAAELRVAPTVVGEQLRELLLPPIEAARAGR